MITTTPSHDRPRTGVPVGGVPAPRPAPTERVSPVAVAVPLPRQRPVTVPAPRQEPTTAAPRRRWSATVDGLATGLTLCTVGAVGAVVALTTVTGPAPASTAPAPPASVSPNVSVPGRVLTVVGDGVWQVGVDVEPGTYRSTGGVDGGTCRHAFRPHRNGADVTASAGPGTVVLTEDDGWFVTSGCATWTRVG